MTSATALLNPSRIDFPWIEQVLERYEADPTVWDRATFPVKALFHLAAHAFTHRPAVVHYISDNGNYADAARGEIAVRLADIPLVFRSISGSPAVRTEYHDIPAQDTNAAAFDLAQFARGTLRGFGNVFFVNCAPRKKQRGVEKSNGGESVYIGILPNGAIVAGTGEDVFVHFRDLIEAGQFNVYRANVATNGTQFRSRDYFPWLAALVGQYIDRPDVNRKWRSGLTVEQRDQILFGLGFVDREVLLNPKHFDILPSFTIIRADTHGNLKLDQRHEKLAVALGDDSHVVIHANGRILFAELVTDGFDNQEGKTGISAGSSGRWRGPDGKILSPFAELFTVGGSARDALGITDKYLRGEDPYFDFISRSIFDEVKRLLQDAFCEPHSRYDEKQIDLAVLSTISAYCFYDYANIGDLREPLRNGSTEFLDGMRDDFLDFLESFQEKACRDSQPVRQNPHWQSRLPEPPGPYPTR